MPGSYGETWAMDGLNNVSLGGTSSFTGSAVLVRMTETDTIDVVTWYVKIGDTGLGSGYSGGTGGTALMKLCPDNGSGLPDESTVLASASFAPGDTGSGFAKAWTLGTPLSVNAGDMIYFVVTNTDGAPGTNWFSVNHCFLGENLTPMQETIPDTDLATFTKQSGSWSLDRSRAPVVDMHYVNSGHHVGQAFSDAQSSSGLKDIYGTGASGHAVRQRFSSAPPSGQPSIGVKIRLYKRAGTTHDLTLLAKNAGGTTLATATIPASSIHLVTDQANSLGGRWAYGAWDSVISDPSVIDRVEAWQTAEATLGNSYQTFPIVDGSFSNVFLAPHFTDGYFEFTTDGSTWSQVTDTHRKAMLFLVLTDPAAFAPRRSMRRG